MTGSARAPRRVLVLYCRDWPQLPPAPPRATAAEPAGSVSAGSVSAGSVSAGSAAAEAAAFESVVSVVEEFCPKVEILRPGACAIGVRGPARYFGGEPELARKITEAVRAIGFACQAGVADGLFAAELAAMIGSAAPADPAGPVNPAGLIVPRGAAAAFLADQPVSALGSPELTYLLPRLGLTTLGEFAALPAAEAASRFGGPGALAHRLARGLDPRPLVPRPPAADLSVGCAFDPPAGQSEPVVFTAKSLAGQLHARLSASGLACVRVQVLVRCEDGQEISRFWRHDGLLSDLAVAERVRWQLDGWRAGRASGESLADGIASGGAAPGGITLLRLIPDQLVRATGQQLALWGDAVISDRVARSAIRVQAILGHGAVTRPVLAGGRAPADQVLLVPFGDVGVPQRPADRPWPGQLPVPAPATVYPVPLAAEVTDHLGATVSVTGRAQVSAAPAWLSPAGRAALAVTSWAGPWPMTERWWDPASARRQARFQLVTQDGSAWLAVVQDGRWLVEASYD